MEFRQVVYQQFSPGEEAHYLLVGDIGGTNMNFGFFVTDTFEQHILPLIASFHCKSAQVKDFAAVVQQVLEHVRALYGVQITKAVFAVAGVVMPESNHVKPTNLSLVIDVDAVVVATSLQEVVLANDFEVISYGLPYIQPSSIVTINNGTAHVRGHKVIIGAGTGLGQATLLWSRFSQRYESLPSEGGHADFVVHSHFELEIIKYIKQQERFDCPLSWEDMLSGNGISRLYSFFEFQAASGLPPAQQSDTRNGFKGPRPDEIFAMRHQNEQCLKTYQMYAQLYARCAKNVVLETLALGGLYIAGGIAAHNVELFQQAIFMQEFLKCGKHAELLRHIPIFVIADYNVSLYGAAAYFLAYR